MKVKSLLTMLSVFGLMISTGFAETQNHDSANTGAAQTEQATEAHAGQSNAPHKDEHKKKKKGRDHRANRYEKHFFSGETRGATH